MFNKKKIQKLQAEISTLKAQIGNNKEYDDKLSKIEQVIKRINRKERFLNILLLLTTFLISGATIYIATIVAKENDTREKFSSLRKKIDKNNNTIKTLSEYIEKEALIQNRIDRKMLYEARDHSRKLLVDVKQKKEQNIVNFDEEIIDDLLIAAYGLNGYLDYQLRDGINSIKSVITCGEEMIKIDSTNSRGYRLKGMGMWRKSLTQDIDVNQIKLNFEYSLRYNESKEYNIDQLNIMEFLFTSGFFKDAYTIGKDLETRVDKIYPSRSAQYAFYLFYCLSGFIEETENPKQHLETLESKISKVLSSYPEGIDLEWGCDFLFRFYKCDLQKMNSIPDSKKDEMRIILEAFFKKVNYKEKDNRFDCLFSLINN